MSKELIAALDALEKENGISKEVMFEAIEKSLMDEYKTQFNTVENGRVVLDRITGDFHIYSDRQVKAGRLSVPNRQMEASQKNTERCASAIEIPFADAPIKPTAGLVMIVTVEGNQKNFVKTGGKECKGDTV